MASQCVATQTVKNLTSLSQLKTKTERSNEEEKKLIPIITWRLQVLNVIFCNSCWWFINLISQVLTTIRKCYVRLKKQMLYYKATQVTGSDTLHVPPRTLGDAVSAEQTVSLSITVFSGIENLEAIPEGTSQNWYAMCLLNTINLVLSFKGLNHAEEIHIHLGQS